MRFILEGKRPKQKAERFFLMRNLNKTEILIRMEYKEIKILEVKT